MVVLVMAGTMRQWFPAPFLDGSGIMAVVSIFYSIQSTLDPHEVSCRLDEGHTLAASTGTSHHISRARI